MLFMQTMEFDHETCTIAFVEKFLATFIFGVLRSDSKQRNYEWKRIRNENNSNKKTNFYISII